MLGDYLLKGFEGLIRHFQESDLQADKFLFKYIHTNNLSQVKVLQRCKASEDVLYIVPDGI